MAYTHPTARPTRYQSGGSQTDGPQRNEPQNTTTRNATSNTQAEQTNLTPSRINSQTTRLGKPQGPRSCSNLWLLCPFAWPFWAYKTYKSHQFEKEQAKYQAQQSKEQIQRAGKQLKIAEGEINSLQNRITQLENSATEKHQSEQNTIQQLRTQLQQLEAKAAAASNQSSQQINRLEEWLSEAKKITTRTLEAKEKDLLAARQQREKTQSVALQYIWNELNELEQYINDRLPTNPKLTNREIPHRLQAEVYQKEANNKLYSNLMRALGLNPQQPNESEDLNASEDAVNAIKWTDFIKGFKINSEEEGYDIEAAKNYLEFIKDNIQSFCKLAVLYADLSRGVALIQDEFNKHPNKVMKSKAGEAIKTILTDFRKQIDAFSFEFLLESSDKEVINQEIKSAFDKGNKYAENLKLTYDHLREKATFWSSGRYTKEFNKMYGDHFSSQKREPEKIQYIKTAEDYNDGASPYQNIEYVFNTKSLDTDV